jgi:Flp pilus assembly protein TadD
MKPLLSSPSRSVIRSSVCNAKRFGAVVGVLVLLCGTPVFADEATDITKLMRAGQLPVALAKVDAALAQRPRDAQMRFLKGLILSEQNKTAEAITVFTKLTEDFPDLPEPYNNLAVLYASSGQYDRARVALESAIRTNPTYATAHENLGDIYAKLASQAYDKALQLDSGNVGAKSKLTMVRTLIGNPGTTTAKAAAPMAAPVAVAAAAAKPVAPPVVLAAASKPAPVPVKAEPAKVEAKPAVKPPEVKSAAPKVDTEEVLKAVEAWARAWSGKDVKTYLSMYANNFQTPKGESMRSWSEERRTRIEGKGRINVRVDAPQVTMDGNAATVKFRQIYVSDRLSSTSRKTLVMEKQGSKWQIKQEHTGS